jgi:hypothetical protein
MKNIITTLGIAICLVANSAFAQTPPPLPTVSSTAPVTDTKGIIEAVKDSGLLNATNWAFVPYATYAPNTKKGDLWGAGALVAYNINPYVGAGFGVDYLGRFSLLSANVSFKYAMPFGKYISSSHPVIKDIELVPFALAGIGRPMGGTDEGVATLQDVGAFFEVGKFADGKFAVGGCWGQWQNAGDYSGTRYHFFLGWSKNF